MLYSECLINDVIESYNENCGWLPSLTDGSWRGSSGTLHSQRNSNGSVKQLCSESDCRAFSQLNIQDPMERGRKSLTPIKGLIALPSTECDNNYQQFTDFDRYSCSSTKGFRLKPLCASIDCDEFEDEVRHKPTRNRTRPLQNINSVSVTSTDCLVPTLMSKKYRNRFGEAMAANSSLITTASKHLARLGADSHYADPMVNCTPNFQHRVAELMALELKTIKWEKAKKAKKKKEQKEKES